ncbi:hypothetical protein E8E13_000274 [Curvularia kusanoi]|uniref:DUF7730 domain-containing protein n=1 Tax=Curvularia kusanoi TaxID=90978 RepID=A0A9P4T2M8_CURKU|nr:hypothetical protein E8E13_000274 [Curvularia kusanoi]
MAQNISTHAPGAIATPVPSPPAVSVPSGPHRHSLVTAPREVRNKVYGFLFVLDTTIQVDQTLAQSDWQNLARDLNWQNPDRQLLDPQGSDPQDFDLHLLRTCRQIYEEGSSMFYQRNTFLLSDTNAAGMWLLRLGQNQMFIREVHIQLSEAARATAQPIHSPERRVYFPNSLLPLLRSGINCPQLRITMVPRTTGLHNNKCTIITSILSKLREPTNIPADLHTYLKCHRNLISIKAISDSQFRVIFGCATDPTLITGGLTRLHLKLKQKDGLASQMPSVLYATSPTGIFARVPRPYGHYGFVGLLANRHICSKVLGHLVSHENRIVWDMKETQGARDLVNLLKVSRALRDVIRSGQSSSRNGPKDHYFPTHQHLVRFHTSTDDTSTPKFMQLKFFTDRFCEAYGVYVGMTTIHIHHDGGLAQQDARINATALILATLRFEGSAEVLIQVGHTSFRTSLLGLRYSLLIPLSFACEKYPKRNLSKAPAVWMDGKGRMLYAEYPKANGESSKIYFRTMHPRHAPSFWTGMMKHPAGIKLETIVRGHVGGLDTASLLGLIKKLAHFD